MLLGRRELQATHPLENGGLFLGTVGRWQEKAFPIPETAGEEAGKIAMLS